MRKVFVQVEIFVKPEKEISIELSVFRKQMPKPEEEVLYCGTFVVSFSDFLYLHLKMEKIYNRLLEQRLSGFVAAGKYEYYVWGILGIRLHLCSRVVFCSST